MRSSAQASVSGLPLAALSALCLLGGCTLNPYPEPVAEVCTGGRDEDFDGQVDCRDPDCDGECAEEGPERCSNDRDDDEDGFTDTDDPVCWPYAAISLTRCRTIAGSTFDLARNEAFWSADHLYYQVDPDGSGRDVLGVGGRDWGRIRVLDSLTGDLDGLELRARIRLDAPADAGASVTFVLSDFALLLRRQNGEDEGAVGLEDWTLFGPVSTGGGWMDVVLRFAAEGDGLVARLRAERPGSAPIEASYSFPEGWPDAPPLELDISLTGTALLDTLTVTRPAYHTCEAPDPRWPSVQFEVAMHSPVEQCVFDAEATRRSVDGVTWEDLPPLAAFARSALDEVPRAAVWDDTAGLYRGLVRASAGEATMVSAATCGEWVVNGALAAPGEPALSSQSRMAMGYLRLSSRLGVRHEAWVLSPIRSLQFWTSPSGEAGTYVRSRELDLDLRPLFAQTLGIGTPVTTFDVVGIGADRVFVVTSLRRSLTTTLSERVLQFFVAHADGSFHEIVDLRQEPSHIEGTFDETDISGADLLLSYDRGWSGLVVVSGSARTLSLAGAPDGGTDRATSGTTLLDLSIRPR